MGNTASTPSIAALQQRIGSIQRLFTLLYNRELGRWDVTIAQFTVLNVLDAHDEATMSDVAAMVGVTTPAMTSLVDRLEDKRLVERHDHPTDRRSKLVRMTPGGREVVNSTRACVREMLTRVMLQMVDRDQAAVAAFYAQLDNELSAELHP